MKKLLRKLWWAGCLSCEFAAMATLPTPTNQVTLAWDPSPDPQVAGYYVYISTEPGAYHHRYQATNSLTLQIPGLIPLTTYYFVVTAYDANGVESSPSNEIRYTAPLAMPGGAAYPIYQKNSVPAGNIATLRVSQGNSSFVTIGTIPGRTYRIWATSNLRDWVLIDTVTAANVATQVEDAGAGANSVRCYRIEQLPQG